MGASRRRGGHAVVATVVVGAFATPALGQSASGVVTPAPAAGAGTTGSAGVGTSTSAAAPTATGAPIVADQQVGRGAPAATAGTQPGARAAVSETAAPRPRWGHRYQVSFRVAGSLGYMFAIRYGGGMGDSDQCATAIGGSMSGAAFCHGRSPVTVDTAIGFGVTETLELEARFRFGEMLFQPNTMNGTGIPLALGIGIRFYGNDESRLKFLLGVAAFVDFTDRVLLARYGTDIQVRLEQGLQYDVARQFGFYFQVGETFGFLRSLGAVLDVGLGVQARVP